MASIFDKLKKPSDFYDVMIRGLEAEHIKVDMRNFGYYAGGVCFGCAATNALCELSGKVFDRDSILTTKRARFLGEETHLVHRFELLIDTLRRGSLCGFNAILYRFRPFEIEFNKDLFITLLREANLLVLGTYDYKEVLPEYKEFRDLLIEKGL